MGLHGFPAIRQPQLRAGIAAVFDKCQIFATSYQARAETKCRNQNFVAGRFVIEMKMAGLAPDLIKVFLISLRLLRRNRSRVFGRLWQSLIRRTQWVGPESMFDIGNNQLLVL